MNEGIFFAEIESSGVVTRGLRRTNYYHPQEFSGGMIRDSLSSILEPLSNALSAIDLGESSYALHEVELQVSLSDDYGRALIVPSNGHLTVRLRRIDGKH